MSKEQEWFLFSFNRAKSLTGMCAWVSEGVRAYVCMGVCAYIWKWVWTGMCLSVCVRAGVCVCVYIWVWPVSMCKHLCVWVRIWLSDRKREGTGRTWKNQRADWPQLVPWALLLESCQSRFLLIFHMPLTQSPHFCGRRMECAHSRRALRDMWLSGLFKRQETGADSLPVD